jgi:alpha-galactosidase
MLYLAAAIITKPLMKLLKTQLLLALCLLVTNLPLNAFAQATKIEISTKDNLLLLGADNGKLKQYYYGKKMQVSNADSYLTKEDAYPTFGVNVDFSALRITHSDGNTTTELVYKTIHKLKLITNITLTTIHLKDSFYPVSVDLNYKTYNNENIIEQWVEVKHQEKGEITVYDCSSGNLTLQNDHYYLSAYTGNWINEYHLTEAELTPGTKVIDSKQGVRTTQHAPPAFLLALDTQLNEDKGAVIGGTLAWPGNWQFLFNLDETNRLRLSGGINPYASEYHLAANKTFKTPGLLLYLQHSRRRRNYP